MLKNFRSYHLAVELYRECKTVMLASYLKDQLLRASSSVVLNLAEGSAKMSQKDRIRFYNIAFASLREIQAIIELENQKLSRLHNKADVLAAHLYKLVKQ